jgi:orotidine-5'-phosphate decarboxylase
MSSDSRFFMHQLPSFLSGEIVRKQSLLCVGLDTDLSKIPAHLHHLPDPIWEFNRRIIDATADYAVAYKPNLAFYEVMGSRGWDTLARTIEYIPKEVFKIADAKRGDIGNTSTMYAKALFEAMDFDAVTVAPYMGRDSVLPFLQFPGKWVFLLALTSNPGAEDFQWYMQDGVPLYRQVVKRALSWAEGQPGHLGFVTGATRAESIGEIRALAPESFFLVPGVGAQGGDLDAVCKAGCIPGGGLLINASRSILYASNGEDFEQHARAEAKALQLATAVYVSA